MSKAVTYNRLGAALSGALREYRSTVIAGVNSAGAKAANELVRITKETAPYRAKAHHRHYRSCIASKPVKKTLGEQTHIWYVKAPCHRLTHLLVHGHATRNGGRTQADPFLKNALDQVLPQYERDVKEAVQHGK